MFHSSKTAARTPSKTRAQEADQDLRRVTRECVGRRPCSLRLDSPGHCQPQTCRDDITGTNSIINRSVVHVSLRKVAVNGGILSALHAALSSGHAVARQITAHIQFAKREVNEILTANDFKPI